jgi:hypothetical protein
MNAHNGLTEKTEKSNNLDTRTIERGLVFKWATKL